MAKPVLTDNEKIFRRKRVEIQWRTKWRGQTDLLALLDLWRNLHRRDYVSLEVFQRFERESVFYYKINDI